jgi:hypothetical protein
LEKQYAEYKQILEEILTELGFSTQSENTTGLSRSVSFVKGSFQLQLVFDLRDQIVILQANKDGKSAGRTSLSNVDGIKDFETKVNKIISPQGFEIEVPASLEKSGGFLSKLFGKKQIFFDGRNFT